MEELKSEMHKAMKQIMNEKSIFTELEKQKVLYTVKNIKQEKPFSKNWLFPKALTGFMTICFILLIGGIGANYFGFMDLNKGDSVEDDINEFYPGMEYGDLMNGWRLINKGPNDGAKSNRSGLLEAIFIGEAEVTGKLIFDNEKGILYFEPDQNEVSSLPVMNYHLKPIRFNFKDQQMMLKIFGITGSVTLDEITIKINKYIAQYRKDEEMTDLVTLDHVVLPEDESVSTIPFALNLDNRHQIILNPELQNIYKEFSITKDDRVLAELSPSEIFQLYYYSEEQNQSDVQYALFIDDDELNPFGSLEAYLKAKQEPVSEKNTEKFLLQLKSVPLKEVIKDDKNAFIQIDEGTGFHIIKNQNGIWKVSWLPLQ